MYVRGHGCGYGMERILRVGPCSDPSIAVHDLYEEARKLFLKDGKIAMETA